MDQNAASGNFTLIVPTFNRPHHLARLIRYISRHYSSRINVIVLDSSAAETAEENRRQIQSASINCRHLVFDQDIPVLEKVLAGLNATGTEFCGFCADDDIVFPEALYQAIEFLSANPGYVSVDGSYLSFRPGDASVDVSVEYSSKGIGANHSGARIFELLQKYESLYYGVYRTTDFLAVLNAVRTISSYHFIELFQSVATVILGKTHRLPIFYAGRQQCEPAEQSREKWQTYYWFAENPSEFVEHYLEYRKELVAFYLRHGESPQMSAGEFARVLDLAHAVFFSANCPAEYLFQQCAKYWPADAYVPAGESSSILSALKGKRRLQLESLFRRLSGLLGSGVGALANPWHLASLNNEIIRLYGPARECRLSRRYSWLASTPEFRHAYKHICAYLSEPAS